MARKATYAPTPADRPLTGAAIPPGLKAAWPRVVACWITETGAALMVHRIGGTAAIVWRGRAHWAVWPHEVLALDTLDDSEAFEQAAALLAMGEPEEVTHARESMKAKARDRSAAAYRKKKEQRGPSQRDFAGAARDALASALKRAGLDISKLVKEDLAADSAQHVQDASKSTPAPARSTAEAPKVGRPTIASQEAKTAKAETERLAALQKYRGPLIDSGLFAADMVERFLAGKPERDCVRWLMSPAGKAAVAASLTPHTDETA